MASEPLDLDAIEASLKGPTNPMLVDCPYCTARVGAPCWTDNDQPKFHGSRWTQARFCAGGFVPSLVAEVRALRAERDVAMRALRIVAFDAAPDHLLCVQAEEWADARIVAALDRARKEQG